MGYLKIVIAILGSSLFSFVPLTFAQVIIGQKIPDFVATATLNGKRFVLGDYLTQHGNKILILTFFSTWCKPSEEGLQYLQRTYHQYEEHGLRVICISTDCSTNDDDTRKFMQKLGVNFPVLLDNDCAISKRYRVTGLPCNFIIDKEGFLRFRCLGYCEDVKHKLEGRLKDLLPNSRHARRKPGSLNPGLPF